MRIITGDGKAYDVAWKPEGRTQEFNIGIFNFNNVAGSLVKQAQPMGRTIAVRFYFQGENYISDSEAFRISSFDQRPWTVNHPLYGVIFCKVPLISFNDSELNITEVSCTLLETIKDETPKFTENYQDQISSNDSANQANLLNSFDQTPSVSNISSMKKTMAAIYEQGKKLTNSNSDYFNAFTTANAAISNATNDPFLAMQNMQAVISAPAKFQEGVIDRMNLLSGQYNSIKSSLGTITGLSAKKIYELQGATLVSSMSLAASTPLDTDFQNPNDVLVVINILANTYNQFITDIDSIQSDNGGLVGNYIPDSTSIRGLYDTVKYTIANLYNIALNSKQQRTVILQNDTNWILLAHRYYGISEDDHEISLLMSQNNGGPNEMFQIKRGRVIVYYV